MHLPETARTVLHAIGLTGPGDARLVLELDLSRGVLTAPPATPQQMLAARHAPTLRAVREGLRRAAADDAVIGLVVHPGVSPLAIADADEVAEAITAFGRSKPTLAWTDSFGELSSGLVGYRLASAAQQVWVQPSGSLGLGGVHLDITLLRGGLDKVGVDPEFGQRKEFKTAADQLAATEITEANREMSTRIADAILDDTVDRVAQRRGLDPEAVRRAVATSPLTARQAVAAGLVDRIGYRDEVYAWLRANWPSPDDHADPDRFGLRYVHRYAKHTGESPLRRTLQRNRPAVAMIMIHGGIVTGPTRPALGGPQAGADTVCAQLRAAGRDDAVKSVVLRVDSPGGSYVASDSVRREVRRLVEDGTPVVASMGPVAASGGYFVAMGASEIVANPTTLTGSIGVLAGKFVTTRLFDKLGLVREPVNAGERAGMMSGAASYTEDEWRVLNEWLDLVYADFTTKAAADRGLPLDELEPLARGRVWVGTDAHERRLVDHLGGVDLAVDRACALAGLDRDAANVRGVGPSIPLLGELIPAESSESPRAAAAVSAALPALGVSTGPEALLAALAQRVGLPVPLGVLSLPLRIEIR